MGNRLTEQLEKMYRLTYGKNSLNENVKSNLSVISEQTVKNDEKKADIVKDDVSELYQNLENALKSGGISQEKRGSMNFKKEVESLQIGLELLGYSLPKHGIDGYFGNETASAVEKFLEKNTLINESATLLRKELGNLGYVEKGSEISSGGEISNEISKSVSDILAKFKEVRPDVKVRVTAGNDNFHQTKSPNSQHVKGNAIDLTLEPNDGSTIDQFLKIVNDFKKNDPKIGFIDEYRSPSAKATAGHIHIQYGGKGVSGGPVTNKTMVVATPEMLKTLINQLKLKNIKNEDIKKYTNINTSTMSEKGKELIANPDFMEKIKDIANTIKVNETSVLKIMNHESKVDPSIINSIGCVGLIQLCPDSKGSGIKTINGKKYDLNELRNDLTKQLTAIKDFWRAGYLNGQIKEPSDLYIYNFFPAAAGKSDEYVLGTKSLSPELIARQNPIFNRTLGRPRDTPLSVGDLKRFYKLTNMI